VELKNIFAEFRGTTPVQLEFEVSGQQIAVIQVSSVWGVDVKPEFEKRVAGLFS
jgi:hypothetical protein